MHPEMTCFLCSAFFFLLEKGLFGEGRLEDEGKPTCFSLSESAFHSSRTSLEDSAIANPFRSPDACRSLLNCKYGVTGCLTCLWSWIRVYLCAFAGFPLRFLTNLFSWMRARLAWRICSGV